MASGPITSWQIDGETTETGAPKSLQMVIAAMKLKDACYLEKNYYQLQQHIKKQRHCFANKSSSSQSYRFSNIHVGMWELDHKKTVNQRTDALNCGVGEDSWEYYCILINSYLKLLADIKDN